MNTFKQFLVESSTKTFGKDIDFLARDTAKKFLGKELIEFGYKEVSRMCRFYDWDKTCEGRIIYECPFSTGNPSEEISKLLILYSYMDTYHINLHRLRAIFFAKRLTDNTIEDAINVTNTRGWKPGGSQYQKFLELNQKNKYQELQKNKQNQQEKYGTDLEDI